MASRIRPHKLPHDPSGLPSNRTKIARNGTRRRSRLTYHERMAVAIASDLGKDMAGEPLLRGVSFKVERRDRLTLSGRNGSGKTTLLRMLAGETSVDFGELVLAKGTRIALHDQRPPRERELSLRDYVLEGCGDLLALEQRAGGPRAGDGGRRLGRRHARPLRRRPGQARACGRLHLARAGDGHRARAGLPRARPRPSAQHLLGRRAHPCLAGSHARGRPRPAAARRAHQPPRHRLARMAGAATHVGGRGGDPRGPRPLVPRVGGHRGAGARGRAARATSPDPGTPGARSRRRASWRSGAPSSASRRRSSGSSAS